MCMWGASGVADEQHRLRSRRNHLWGSARHMMGCAACTSCGSQARCIPWHARPASICCQAVRSVRGVSCPPHPSTRPSSAAGRAPCGTALSRCRQCARGCAWRSATSGVVCAWHTGSGAVCPPRPSTRLWVGQQARREWGATHRAHSGQQRVQPSLCKV